MKIWMLEPKDNLPKDNPWEPWYDKAFGFIVVADTEESARKLANDNGGDEVGPVGYVVYRTGGDPWLDKELSTCTELKAVDFQEEQVIMYDFKSA